MGEGNVFETISHQYYNLTASEKKTADYVMGHPNETQYMSISELAEESRVAEATVSRFCRRLGYKGYNAFKLAIANATAQQTKDLAAGPEKTEQGGSFEETKHLLYAANNAAMLQTIELLEEPAVAQAVDLLQKADKVLCMGQGGSMLIAKEAAHIFSTVSGKFFAVSDAHTQVVAAVNIDPKDVVLYFSYSGATRDMIETLSIVRKQGAKVLLITRFPKAPGAAYADVVLRCGSRESPLQLGSVAAKIAQLFLIDVLFDRFCRKDLPHCRLCREKIAEALNEKHI